MLPARYSLYSIPENLQISKCDLFYIDHVTDRVPIGLHKYGASTKYTAVYFEDNVIGNENKVLDGTTERKKEEVKFDKLFEEVKEARENDK